MIKIENTSATGWEAAIRGMRNPMNSWEKSDSYFWNDGAPADILGNSPDIRPIAYMFGVNIGPKDFDLMKRLATAGPVDAKYRRMITVTADVTAPLYWWKEYDTYKVGTVANSCSTMHKIHAKEFTRDDFSCEHLSSIDIGQGTGSPYSLLQQTIRMLNECRELYLKTKDKQYWWQMIQLLPSSYNQKRTIMLNYEVLAGIYPKRKDHKLDEWHEFCKWIEALPYSAIITGN